MINFLEPLPAGNALRILINPSPGVVAWSLLRKTADTFTGPADSGAVVVAAGFDDHDASVLDIGSLVNGTPYFYRQYESLDGVTFTSGASATGTPAATAGAVGPDPLTIVRDRLFQAMTASVAAGVLSPKSGAIKVLTAPPLFEDTQWPVVTVHLRSDASDVRAIGELISPDLIEGIGEDTIASEGWLSRFQLQVIGWSDNPDERITLRQALKAAIVANLAVFDSVGMVQVDAQFSDIEDFESYNAPVYQTLCTFSCLAPFAVAGLEPPITVVDVTNQPVINP